MNWHPRILLLTGALKILTQHNRTKWLAVLSTILLLTVPAIAMAQANGLAANGLAALTGSPGPGGSTTYSVSIQTLLIFGALSLLPAVLLLMTGFTRIVIVLSLLRTAMGTQSAPPTQVLIGLSLFLTFYVMSPVLDKIYNEAYKPYTANQIQIGRAHV